MASDTGLIGSTILHYQIIERLGAGGMGEVYLADDTRLGRRVALKFLTASSAEGEARDRLIREAQAAAVLRSPHIAVTYDLVEHGDSLFIVMEYVEGELLSARIARGPLSLPDALDIAVQIADALDEAHTHSIVHRDIKSANLMLTTRQLVKVLDFGLAKYLRAPSRSELATLASMTMPGSILGTLNYMAPEQVTGGAVDHRSDLFATGVVLYEMLTGRVPFTGASAAEIAERILHHEPDAIARYNYSVPADVETIVRKALEKNPDFRYQSARELYIDLHGARRRLSTASSSHALSPWRGPAVRQSESETPKRHGDAIAVLNFANITADPSVDWIGQGIAETLTADLTRLQTLTVVPREQIFELQRTLLSAGRSVDERQAIDLGRRLGASVAVSGAYQAVGGRIRITAQAIEVESGRVLATVKVDGRIEEIFDLQDRMVTELAQGLQVPVAPQEALANDDRGTESMEAYQAYARGMLNLRLAGRDSIDRAIALLEQAVQKDPTYVEAKVALSGALELKGSFLALPDLFARSLALADEALHLRPDSGDAHVQRGDTLLSMGRVDEAIGELREGVRLQPERAAAHAILARAYWLGKGQIDEAIKAFEQTLVLNPSAGYTTLQLAFLYTLRGEYARAEELANAAIRLQDQAMSGTTGLIVVGAHSRLGYVHYRQGRYDDAIREYRRELELLSVGDHLLRERTSIELHQKLGAAYRRKGDMEPAQFHENQALQLFDTRLAAGADEPFTRYYVAALFALRGEAEDARRHLERPLRELAALTRWRVPRDPDFDLVKHHHAFKDVIA